ncbi:heme A synthase [Bradyrhizobium elkanii]
MEQRVAEGFEVTETVREFIERFTGRALGVQLLLPLRQF